MDIKRLKPGRYYLFGRNGHQHIVEFVGPNVDGRANLRRLDGGRFLGEPKNLFDFDHEEDFPYITREEEERFRGVLAGAGY